jgi:hypothetical protein
MKIALAALAVLLPATAVLADSVTSPNADAVLIIPDGSTITSEYLLPDLFGGPGVGLGVNFTIPDGTGTAEGLLDQGDEGEITFAMPVVDLTITWTTTDPGSISTNAGGEGSFGPATETFFLSGPVTNISWLNFEGYSGIESLSYTVDPVNAPEPSAFLLSGLGLAALIGLSCCLCRGHGVIPPARK